MALIVEDGTGKSDAESYISISDATTYFDGNQTNDPTRIAQINAWSSATTTIREGALREATRYLDGNYLDRWTGLKGKGSQALAWPRIQAVDAYGYEIATNAIPTALKHAAAELTLRAVSTSVLPDQDAGSGPLTAKSISAGSVSLSQSFGTAGARTEARYERVEALLRPILAEDGSGVVALARA